MIWDDCFYAIFIAVPIKGKVRISSAFGAAMICARIRSVHSVLQSKRRRVAIAAAKFRRTESGNVAIIFAMALVPVMALIGSAVDYSRVNLARTAMQAALDSTALMLSAEAPNKTPEALKARAQELFGSIYQRSEVGSVTVNATYTAASNGKGAALKLSASGTVPTTFLKVVNINKIDFGSAATASWGSGPRLRIALVLDNSGSMRYDGKMTSLKTAAKTLIDDLSKLAVNPDDIYISLVPFTQFINVGTANAAASWLDRSLYEYCRQPWWSWDDFSIYKTQTACTKAGGYWTNNISNWGGCITDRGNDRGPSPSNYDQNTSPAVPSILASMFRAARMDKNTDSCLSAVTNPLSKDLKNMSPLIDDMVADGATNQSIGLVWGWQSLSAGGPMPVPPYDASYQYKHIVILLSDGENTCNRWWGNCSNHSVAVDNRMYNESDNGSGTCRNFKTTKIPGDPTPVSGGGDINDIYTIQVDTDGTANSSLLQNCASSGKFYRVTNASDIIKAFKEIGQAITKLRLTS